MDYVIKSGNFGVKLNQLDSYYVSGLYQFRHPIMAIKDLQQKGYARQAIKGTSTFKPFIWIVEAGRRIRTTPNIFRKYQNARKTNALFKALGVRRQTD